MQYKSVNEQLLDLERQDRIRREQNWKAARRTSCRARLEDIARILSDDDVPEVIPLLNEAITLLKREA
jgi:hypothetical protein